MGRWAAAGEDRKIPTEAKRRVYTEEWGSGHSLIYLWPKIPSAVIALHNTDLHSVSRLDSHNNKHKLPSYSFCCPFELFLKINSDTQSLDLNGNPHSKASKAPKHAEMKQNETF